MNGGNIFGLAFSKIYGAGYSLWGGGWWTGETGYYGCLVVAVVYWVLTTLRWVRLSYLIISSGVELSAFWAYSYNSGLPLTWNRTWFLTSLFC
jgi:hypothetical protein